MNQPQPLQKGSKIALIAPAGRVFPKDLEFAKEWTKNNDWELVYDESLFTDFNLGYHYAGTDALRLEQMQKALDNDEVAAIWCARGGYGSVKLIDQLDFSKFVQNPKWLIGYSDITVFHNHLNNLGIPTLHAVTAKKLNTEYSNETYHTLVSVLHGIKNEYRIPSHRFNQEGTAKGKLVGGNLSIIYSQLGSKTAIQGENLILFIEDWCENWYHVDRMLMALKRSGLLKRVKGLIVGSFTQMDVEEENPDFYTNYDEKTYEVIHHLVKELDIPVAYHFPAGHIGDNRALVLGREVELIINSSEGKLIL